MVIVVGEEVVSPPLLLTRWWSSCFFRSPFLHALLSLSTSRFGTPVPFPSHTVTFRDSSRLLEEARGGASAWTWSFVFSDAHLSRRKNFPPSRRLRTSRLRVWRRLHRRFYNPGMPAETPIFNRTLCEESEGLADKWASAAYCGESKPADAEEAKFEAWTSPQKVCFLSIKFIQSACMSVCLSVCLSTSTSYLFFVCLYFVAASVFCYVLSFVCLYFCVCLRSSFSRSRLITSCRLMR